MKWLKQREIPYRRPPQRTLPFLCDFDGLLSIFHYLWYVERSRTAKKNSNSDGPLNWNLQVSSFNPLWSASPFHQWMNCVITSSVIIHPPTSGWPPPRDSCENVDFSCRLKLPKQSGRIHRFKNTLKMKEKPASHSSGFVSRQSKQFTVASNWYDRFPGDLTVSNSEQTHWLNR